MDLPRIFGKYWVPHLYIFLNILGYFHFFNPKSIVDKRGAPKAPPPITLSILGLKKMKNMQKQIKKVYKDGGDFFPKNLSK